MSLVRNEQLKLTANYLNGGAVALAAIGGFAPLVAALSATAVLSYGPAITALVCFSASAALHYIARRILRGLRE